MIEEKLMGLFIRNNREKRIELYYFKLKYIYQKNVVFVVQASKKTYLIYKCFGFGFDSIRFLFLNNTTTNKNNNKNLIVM